jgi:hypothetical protein
VRAQECGCHPSPSRDGQGPARPQHPQAQQGLLQVLQWWGQQLLRLEPCLLLGRGLEHPLHQPQKRQQRGHYPKNHQLQLQQPVVVAAVPGAEAGRQAPV